MTTQFGGGGAQPLSPVAGRGRGHGGDFTRVVIVGQTGEPVSIVVRRAAYEEINDCSLHGHDFMQMVGAPWVVPGTYRVYTVPSLAGSVLDLTEISVCVLAPVGLLYDAMANWALAGYCRWVMMINERPPWDQMTTDGALPVPARQQGWRQLNENVLSVWNTPTHLAVLENQTLTVDLVVEVALPLGPTARVVVRTRGRWIPVQTWRDAIAQNS